MTELEKQIFEGFVKSDFFEDGLDSCPWVFSVFDAVDIDHKIGRGIISSLVKKEMMAVGDSEGQGKARDMYVELTPAGKEEMRQQGIYTD